MYEWSGATRSYSGYPSAKALDVTVGLFIKQQGWFQLFTQNYWYRSPVEGPEEFFRDVVHADGVLEAQVELVTL